MLTRLLDTRSLTALPGLHILIDNMVALASYVAALAHGVSPEAQLTLMLTFTTLSLTFLTSLLTHAWPSASDAPRIVGTLVQDMLVFANTIGHSMDVPAGGSFGYRGCSTDVWMC
ncbi:hypothetical protein CALVIDRAFT_96180 [Calocera viscosa TUFC12733]|uniref:Uncharacterized protein n=1 Tax=Calocera viscosa (strain TUFC12733) TaxID=1330018 RepID=A0A167MXV8_CALVF|nr:hypothetical protein CALVIDRAFT_96180 [Calocera viscosa TUFC12733]